MIELKVQCDCGQKYKFDVEPVNGQMPFAVTCPLCSCDGTAKANVLLQQHFPPAPAPVTAIPPIAPIAAAAPPAPAKLKLNLSASAESHSAPPTLAAATSASGAMPPPIGTLPRRTPGAPAVAATEPGQPPSFAKGLLGAFIGALVGAIIYFLIYKTTGSFFLLRYILAIGVGALTGWLANLLGKGEGSKELGSLAAVFTIVGIVGAQYFLESAKLHEGIDASGIAEAIEDGGFTLSVKQAKEVVKAIPNGSNAEIRMYIAKQQAEDGAAPKLEAISDDEVKQFRDTELTNYLDLASGKLTKEAFWTKNGFDPKEAKKLLDTGENAVTGLTVIIAVFKAGIISMIAGAGLAYKLSTNA